LQVRVAGKNGFDDIRSLAIAISGDSSRRHVGILFRPDEQPVQLIHLGWHGLLEREPPSNDYCWVSVKDIHPVVLDNIADWLPQVWRENGRAIPYSIKPFDVDPFDENGKLRATLPGEGFTCATFVLWVFHHFKVGLIDAGTWQDRPDDRQWRAWIVEMLERTKIKYQIPDDHIEAQTPYVRHAARFRPEEVAGAAANYQGEGAAFRNAVDYGIKILDGMKQLGRLPDPVDS